MSDEFFKEIELAKNEYDEAESKMGEARAQKENAQAKLNIARKKFWNLVGTPPFGVELPNVNLESLKLNKLASPNKIGLVGLGLVVLAIVGVGPLLALGGVAALAYWAWRA